MGEKKILDILICCHLSSVSSEKLMFQANRQPKKKDDDALKPKNYHKKKICHHYFYLEKQGEICNRFCFSFVRSFFLFSLKKYCHFWHMSIMAFLFVVVVVVVEGWHYRSKLVFYYSILSLSLVFGCHFLLNGSI